MKIKFTLLFLPAFLMCVCSLSVANGQTAETRQTENQLTNSDIKLMLDAGLGADVVVAKIQKSSCKFDTSLSELKNLKEAGFPDAVILAMVQYVAPGNSENTLSANTENTEQNSAKPKVYIYRHKEFNTRNMQPSIYVDGTEAARIDDGKYFILTLEPGKHSILVNKGHSGAEVEMKSGQEYYFKVSIKAGFLKGRGEIDFVQKEQGALEIKKMEPLEEKWIKDKSLVSVESAKTQK